MWSLRERRRRLATALEWPAVDKGLLLLGWTLPLYVQYLLWAAYVNLRADRERLVHVDALHTAMAANFSLLVVGVIIALWGNWLRCRRPDFLPFQHVAVQFFGISLVLVSYQVGTLSFPAGVVLLGTPIFGFILLDRLAVWLAALVALAMLVVLSYATALDYLPYAPVVVPPESQVARLFWMNSTFFFTAPFLIFITIMADHLLGWWRDREDRIRELSRTDALTGLHNRRSILELLDRALAAAMRQGAPVSVVILDLDHFKRINDTWGHPVGDRVLQKAAAVLREEVRSGDLVGRYGGEEFMVVLPGADAQAALGVMERCRLALAAAEVLSDGNERVGMSASFGVVVASEPVESQAGHLILRADEALYQAKANGRNRVHLADVG